MTVNNTTNTTHNTINIVVGGEQVQGTPLLDMIRHPAAAGTHKKMLEIIEASGFDFMELQESFDNAVRMMSNSKKLDHDRTCLGEMRDMFTPGRDGNMYCFHSRHGFEHAHQLDVDEMNTILCDQLMRNPGRFYLWHVPKVGMDDIDMRVVHTSDTKAMFPVIALKKLCENSTSRDLMVFDMADYKPGISTSRYLDYYNQCYEKVLRHMQQDNHVNMQLANRRRRGG
jgi:hypothetical protein